jgi:hypothetical protein
MHYRSVMALGTFTVLDGDDHADGLRLITEHLLPARWVEVRAPRAQELKATKVLAMDLAEVSVKVSAGPPDDPDHDIAGDAWAGVLPLRTIVDAPIAAPDLRSGIPIPESVRTLIGSTRSTH